MSAVVVIPQRVHDSGTMEALKWVALLAMVVDHVNTVFFARSVPWMYEVGRIAFPIFALVLAENMARPRAELYRMALGLAAVGAMSMLPVMLTVNAGNPLPLNVMFTFLLAVGMIVFIREGLWPYVIALAPAALWVDYQWAGVAVVVTAWWWLVTRRWEALVATSGALVALCVYNGNPWALAGVAIFAAGFAVRVPLPRLRYVFWALYPVHLVGLYVIAKSPLFA